MKYTYRTLIAASLLALTSAATYAQGNAGFENGPTGLAPWVATGNAGVQNYTAAHGGTYFFAFNAGQSTPNGTLTQSVGTVAGSSYTLSFWHGVEAYNQTAIQKITAKVKNASGTVLATRAFISDSVTAGTSVTTNWVSHSLNFTADGTLVTIEFDDDTTNPTFNTDSLVDDVVVTTSAGLGNDNPTGVASGYPYTANASRAVNDITVTGATGEYGLAWTRFMNSRLGVSGSHFGSTAWSHSYAWTASTTESVNSTPGSYDVQYPDGRLIHFIPSNKQDSDSNVDTNYMGPPGVGDRFQQAAGTGDCYLLFTDGGKIHFRQIQSSNPVSFTFKPVSIVDPYGLETTITLDNNNNITQVKEPAGRWLNVYYDASGNINRVDAGYHTNSTDTITQSVSYTYGTRSYGGTSYTVLDSVTYTTDPGSPAASYTYQPSNVSPFNGTPLISTCSDLHYGGAMKKAKYEFVQNGAYGQLSKLDYIDGTAIMTLTVNGNIRTETRGDGPSKTWTYGTTSQTGFSVPQPYLLGDVTDFVGVHTYLSYDTNYYLNKIKDGRGNVTSITNNVFTGVPRVVTHPGDASTVQYFYMDVFGVYLEHVVDELNRQTILYKRDGARRVQRIDYADGSYETFAWSPMGKQSSHKTRAGGSYVYGYDSGGRGLLLTVTEPFYTNITTYTYDANDHVQTVKDQRNNTTTLTYDALGRLTNLQHPAPNVSSIVWHYNTDSTLHDVVDELGHQTSYTYDDYERITSVATPGRGCPDGGSPCGDTSPHVTTFWYDTNGAGLTDYTHADSNVTRLVLASGKIVKAAYDADLRKSTVTTAFGTPDASTTSFTYNEVGEVKTVTDPNGQVTGAHWTFNYDDPRNRLTSVDDPISTDRIGAAPNNHTTMWTYDACNNVKTITRTNGQVISNDTFNSMNRVTQRTTKQSASLDAVEKFTYWEGGSGLLRTYQDPKLVQDNSAEVYNYQWDQQGRLQAKLFPMDANGIRANEVPNYDECSNVVTWKNRAGNTLTTSFDERNRPYYKHWDDGVTPDVSIGYDTASRVTSINNANANLGYLYYNDNLPYSETIAAFPSVSPAPPTHPVTHTFDTDGNLATLTYPGQPFPGPPWQTFAYSYTNRNQLDSIQDVNGQWAKYVYDLSGNRTHRKLNSAITDTVYGAADALNRIPSISTAFTSGGTATFNYGFDIVSRLTFEQRNSGTADGYGYDLADQIVGFNRDGSLSGGTVTNPTEAMILTFDANGNRLHTVDNGSPEDYVTNAAGQYTTDSNGSATYDGNGNLKTTADGWTYTHDALNRLTKADNNAPITHIINYYDGLGRQVARDENGSRTYSIWDGWNLIQEYDSSGNLLNNYLHGAGADEMVARWSTTSGGGSNVVSNPGFENGTSNISPWTAAGNASVQSSYAQPHGGTYFFAFNSAQSTPNGTVSQTINTTPGTLYTVSFWHGIFVWNQTQTQKINVTAKDSSGNIIVGPTQFLKMATAGTTGVTAWQQDSITFTATSSTSTIVFADVSTNPTMNTDLLLDDVSVTGGSSNRVWYHQDGRGNISHLTDDSGALKERYTYDLGGTPYFWNATGGSISASAYNNRFLYSGRDYSALTKMYDFRNRFYRPDISRFLQSDPIGHDGGSNLYRFCENSQVNRADPLGLGTFIKTKNGWDYIPDPPPGMGEVPAAPGMPDIPEESEPASGPSSGSGPGSGSGPSGNPGWSIATSGASFNGNSFGGLAGTNITVGPGVTVGGGNGAAGVGTYAVTPALGRPSHLATSSDVAEAGLEDMTEPFAQLASLFIGPGEVGMMLEGEGAAQAVYRVGLMTREGKLIDQMIVKSASQPWHAAAAAKAGVLSENGLRLTGGAFGYRATIGGEELGSGLGSVYSSVLNGADLSEQQFQFVLQVLQPKHPGVSFINVPVY